MGRGRAISAALPLFVQAIDVRGQSITGSAGRQVAVAAHGAAAFEEGLKHAVRRSVEVEFNVEKNYRLRMIHPARAASFFQTTRSMPLHDRTDIEAGVVEHLLRESTVDDTHPSPQERFRLARRVASTTHRADERPVWSLFRDPVGVEKELQQRLETMMDEQAKLIIQVTQPMVMQLMQIIARQPSAEGLYQRAQLFHEQGKYQSALDDLKRLLEMAPDADIARLLRVRVLLDVERTQEATWDLDVLLKQAQGNDLAEFYTAAGRAYLVAGRFQEAIGVLTRAVTARPKAWAALVLRGLAQLKCGRRQEGEQDLAVAETIFPDSKAFVSEARSAAESRAG